MLDRRAPEKGFILSNLFLNEFKQAQFILQSARKKTIFNSLHSTYPFTIYMYKILEDKDYGDFDLYTNILGQSIAIRLGKIGLIFVNDGGLQYEIGPNGPLGLHGRRLHPLQFSEVAARVHYKSTLRDATHAYMSSETPNSIVINQISVLPFSKVPLADGTARIFRDWDDIECAYLVGRYWRNWAPPAYDPESGLFSTTLSNRRGGIQSPKRFLTSRG